MRILKTRYAIGLGLLMLLLVGRPATAQSNLPSGFEETTFIDLNFGLVAMAFAPDGRLFVTDQGNGVRIVENGALLATPFLSLDVPTFHQDVGVLGIAFDPDYENNGYFYVQYTVDQGQSLKSIDANRVSRFTTSTTNPNVAVPSSELILLDVLPSEHGNHIHFGLDGKLYVSLGGDHSGGPEQSLQSYQGKLLRINGDGSIPSDNPDFSAVDPNAFPEIWAYGLRNPFTYAWDPVTGELYINDVGRDLAEEINVGVSSANYGWDFCEGVCSPANPLYVDPIYQYGHTGGACAITGGTFYRGSNFPSEYVGKYFFLDFCGNWIRTLDPTNPNDVQTFATNIEGNPVDMTVGPDGSLYYISRGQQSIQRIEFVGGAPPPPPPPPGSTTVYEGEDLTLSNGYVASTNCVCGSPSGGQCARNEGTVGTPATISTTHPGPAGAFQVDITYCDESDDGGAPDSYVLKINGVNQASWSSSDGSGQGEIWQTESTTVTLAPGDALSIDSTRGSSVSWPRVDKIELLAINTDCGNGSLDSGEVCELGQSQTCVDGSGYAGSQDCNTSCAGYAACVTTEFCGDGIVQAGAGETCDDGASNGALGFCNTQCNGITVAAPTFHEAEDLTLTNGNVASTNCICGNPSAGQCARNEASVGTPATAGTTYAGPGGAFQVDITYCDESDDGGAPDSYAFKINSIEQVSWTSSDGPGAGETWQTESATVTLVAGDLVSIDSTRGSSASWARVDYMMLTPTSNPTCGDGVVEPGEVCELGQNQTCVDGSGYAGSQDCNTSCTGYAACVTTEFCGDGIVQAGAGETCDDGASNGALGFCNTQCNGLTAAPPVLTDVVITPTGQLPMTVDPQQGFSVFGAAFTVEAFDQYGNPIQANFACTVTEN